MFACIAIRESRTDKNDVRLGFINNIEFSCHSICNQIPAKRLDCRTRHIITRFLSDDILPVTLYINLHFNNGICYVKIATIKLSENTVVCRSSVKLFPTLQYVKCKQSALRYSNGAIAGRSKTKNVIISPT